MISKEIKMNDVGKSSFDRLVDYITDHQGNELRVQDVKITNCNSTTLKDAVAEIQATQMVNQRTKLDKTLHLLLSFKQEDAARLTPELREKIEYEYCQRIGLGNNQRISVFHGDTDNPHIHIAINKIDPKTFRINNPKGLWKAMASACKAIEQEYNLKLDNHGFEKTKSQDRVNDAEKMSGKQTLCSYIQKIENLKTAKSWKEFHQICKEHNISLKLRGNGFVFTDGKHFVKASTVNRNFSKAKLEKKYGNFTEEQKDSYDLIVTESEHSQQKQQDFDFNDRSRENTAGPKQQTSIDLSQLKALYIKSKQYDSNTPADNYKYMNSEQNQLYQQYVQYRIELNYKQKKKQAFKDLKEQYRELYENRKFEIKLIQESGLDYALKKMMYSIIKKNIEQNKEALYLAEKFRLRKLREKNTWRGYLHSEALHGNETAVEILRNTKERKLNAEIMQKLEEKLMAKAQPVYVTKSGGKIYRTAQHYIRLSTSGLFIQKIDSKNSINWKKGFTKTNLNAITGIDTEIAAIIRLIEEQKKKIEQENKQRTTGKIITAIRNRAVDTISRIKEKISKTIHKGRKL